MRYDRGSQNQDLHGRLRTIAAMTKQIWTLQIYSVHACAAARESALPDPLRRRLRVPLRQPGQRWGASAMAVAAALPPSP